MVQDVYKRVSPIQKDVINFQRLYMKGIWTPETYKNRPVMITLGFKVKNRSPMIAVLNSLHKIIATFFSEAVSACKNLLGGFSLSIQSHTA